MAATEWHADTQLLILKALWVMQAQSYFGFGKFSVQAGKRRATAVKTLALILGLSLQAFATPPVLDENGYYWSETTGEKENPVIWDRAELQPLTNGKAQWVLNDGTQTLVKPATGKFYETSENPRLNELVQALQTMRAKNQQTEAVLEQTLRNSVQLADQGQVNRFNDLILRLRKGEKGGKIEAAMNEFIIAPDTKRLLADRDAQRKAAFDVVENLNQHLRAGFSQRILVGQVKTMVISERALLVPTEKGGKPLDTDEGKDGYSEALGIAYHLIQQQDGTYYAILTNKPQPGSAGDTLELLLGDAVTALNDQPIRSATDLERVTTPQTIVTVARQLDGQPRRLVVQFNSR